MPFLSCKGGVGIFTSMRTCLLCVNSLRRLHCTDWMWSRWLACICSQWPPSGGQILFLCSWTAQESVGRPPLPPAPVGFGSSFFWRTPFRVRLLPSSLQHTPPGQLMPPGHSDIRCLCLRFVSGHRCLLLQS